MNERVEKLGGDFIGIIVAYHLQANEAVDGVRKHYPLITEARDEALKACKEAGLRFVDLPTGYTDEGIVEIEL